MRAKALRAGDVGALADVDEQRVRADVERLQAGQAQRRFQLRAARAARRLRPPSAMAAMCAGVVPQQPPTMLSKPELRPVADVRRPSLRRLVVVAEGVGQAGVGVGGDEARRPCATVPRRTGAARSAPSAQLRPMDSGRAWRSEFQNASAVWPDSVRPEASVMVPEIITGSARAGSLEILLDGEQRGLGVERVENGLDQQDVGAAVDQAVDRFGDRPRPVGRR